MMKKYNIECVGRFFKSIDYTWEVGGKRHIVFENSHDFRTVLNHAKENLPL